MLLAYMDEAYDADRYRLTALLVEHHHVNRLQLRLREVIEDAIKAYGVPSMRNCTAGRSTRAEAVGSQWELPSR